LLCREEEKEHGWKLRRSRDEKTGTDRGAWSLAG